MGIKKTIERKCGAAVLVKRMVSQPTRIEQPSSIKGHRWFFARGFAGGFGAEYGPTLDVRTVAARCAKKAGAGKLVNIKGVWHWLANDELSHRRPKRSASPEYAIGGCDQ